MNPVGVPPLVAVFIMLLPCLVIAAGIGAAVAGIWWLIRKIVNRRDLAG